MALPQNNFNGHAALQAAAQVRPLLTLTIYNHAVILRREEGDGGAVEYPVDPSEMANALAAKAKFSTGFLTPNTLFVGQDGSERTVIEFRPAQVTGIWLEGSEDALRVPLPPLVMVRTTRAHASPAYQVYAVKRKPKSPKEPLFWAPLPHVQGGVCWGTVALPSPDSLKGSSLSEDWGQFLGSRFGNHTVDGKSKSHKGDVRTLYYALQNEMSYPLGDLVKAGKKTLADLMKV
jgi:hypothetical protein